MHRLRRSKGGRCRVSGCRVDRGFGIEAAIAVIIIPRQRRGPCVDNGPDLVAVLVQLGSHRGSDKIAILGQDQRGDSSSQWRGG